MRIFSVVFILAFLLVLRANAQPSLTIDRLTTTWPAVELEFTAKCNGQLVSGIAPSELTLTENGVPVTAFTLDCPPGLETCRSSVALLFDVSGSMDGSGIAGAKLAGHEYVDKMRSTFDEAAIVLFNQVVTILQPMTKYKALLHSNIEVMAAGGATALWDGLYAAVSEAARGTGDARAVIALSDGQDNASSRMMSEVVALAQAQRVRIYIVGLGSSIDATELESIAQATDGEYMQTPNAGQLAAIYGLLAEKIFNCVPRCTLRYISSCADGQNRELRLTIPKLCGNGATAQRSFRAPLDTSDHAPLPLRFNSVHSMARREITLQLMLSQQIENTNLYPSNIRVTYDTASLELKSVDVPPISLIRGVQWTRQLSPGLVQMQTSSRALMHGSGVLFEFIFRTRDTDDTLCSSIDVTQWNVSAGCMRPQVAPGNICVYPWLDAPLVACDIAPSQPLEWRMSRRDYVPDPFTVMARFDNNGGVAAKNGVFVVEYDRLSFRRIRPDHDTIIYSAADVMAGSHAAVAWDFEALHRGDAAVLPICIRGQFDNHADVYCCSDISVPAAGPVLVCGLSAPDVLANPNRGEYDPMPLPATLTVTNTGLTASDSVRVRIAVPPDLALASGETEEKLLYPATLAPKQQGGVEWKLVHAPTAVKRQYLIEAWAHSRDADSSRCEDVVNIPALNIVGFRATLQRSGPLEICEGAAVTLDPGGGYDTYRWNTGDTTRKLSARQSGIYYCALTLGARTGSSDTVTVTVHPRPRPVLQAAGSLPLCPGDTVWIDAGADYASYSWSSGLAVRRFPATRIGSYYVDVIDDAGCGGRSDTITVTMFPAAAIPVIVRSGDLLETADAAAWQWRRGGVSIPGATARTFTLAEPGIYTVRVTDVNGCSAVSDPYIVNVLGLRDAEAAAFALDVWPNPGRGLFTVAVHAGSPVDLVVTDLLGRVILRYDDMTVGGGFQLDLRSQPAGVYVLTAISREYVGRQVLLLEKE